MWSTQTIRLIESACEEDLGPGDITSALLPNAAAEVAARIVPREPGTVCGLALAPAICETFSNRLGDPLEFTPADSGDGTYHDGDAITSGTVLATLHGPRAAVLAVERTLLNFLSRMSGVATLTRCYVEAARSTNPAVKILDTRKTIPGWRELDKYAVRAGGGHNHRAGLYDAVLIKDNHLAGIPTERLAAELAALLKKGWPSASAEGDMKNTEQSSGHPRPHFIEVEVDNLGQFVEVCKVAAVDIVLLDNFSLQQMRAAVEQRDARGLRGKLELEASGGVMLDTVAQIAATGIDRISVGGLTHSATCLDLGLDV
ncbi:MAG: nicotinate-nucleotide diphosphorylase [Phycisphaerae bacterium]|nr:nicotinate-nucleotide diphosphorylase [Phycisphaerae bacterium]